MPAAPTPHPLPPPVAAPSAVSRGIDVPALLRLHGVRPTLPRLRVLEALIAHEPVAGFGIASEAVYAHIHQQGAAVSLATVYSVLAQLAGLGLLTRYRQGRRPAVYALKRSGPRTARLVCTGCGAARPITDPATRAQLLDIAQSHGFAVDEPTLSLNGLCVPCAQDGQAQPESLPPAGSHPRARH